MSAALTILLTLIEGLIPSAAPAVIDEILKALIAIVPTLVNEGTAAITGVKNLIAALQSTGNATPAQMTTLQSLDAQCDAQFEAAAAADSAGA